jgi:hypothetical protein
MTLNTKCHRNTFNQKLLIKRKPEGRQIKQQRIHTAEHPTEVVLFFRDDDRDQWRSQEDDRGDSSPLFWAARAMKIYIPNSWKYFFA